MSAGLCALTDFVGHCRHVMQVRCQHCGREQYAPLVWDVSHGACCPWCGTAGVPVIKP